MMIGQIALLIASWQVSLAIVNQTRLACAFADTMDISGSLSPNSHVSDFSSLDPSTRAVLDHGRFEAHLKRDGSFSIKKVPSGVYIFEIASNEYAFDRYWIDVNADAKVVRASKWTPGTQYEASSKFAAQYPLVLIPLGKYGYFTPREKFNWLSMIQNPMVLMPLLALGAMYVMPKMMEGLDPEELKEVQERQQRLLGGMTGANGGPQVDIAERLASMFGPAPGKEAPKETEKKKKK